MDHRLKRPKNYTFHEVIIEKNGIPQYLDCLCDEKEMHPLGQERYLMRATPERCHEHEFGEPGESHTHHGSYDNGPYICHPDSLS